MKNRIIIKSPKTVCIGIIVISIFYTINSFSQISDLYWTNYTSFNPGSSGLFNRYQGVTMLRLQENIGGETPYYFYNSFNAKIEKLHGGMGLNTYKSELFDQNEYSYSLNYSYHMKIRSKYVFGLGIAFDYKYTYFDMQYVYNIEGNNLIDQVNYKYHNYGVNFGLVLKSEKLETGYSFYTHIKGSDFKNYTIHNGFMTFNLKISDYLKVSPGFMYLYNIYHGYDDKLLNLNLKITYKDRFWICGFHRESIDYPADDKWFGIGAGYDFKGKYRLGYSKYFDSKEGYSGSDEFVISVIIN